MAEHLPQSRRMESVRPLGYAPAMRPPLQSLFRAAVSLALGTTLALAFFARVEASEAAAWDQLRAGGVVLFRHANAPGIGDPPGFSLDDCATQRNLGAAGREQAARIGDRLRTERVVVTVVLSSQWCRALETARLAFPGMPKANSAFNSFFGDRSQEPQTTAEARRVILSWTGPGVLAVVTHDVNIRALTGIGPADGEGIVLRVGPNGFEVVGRIRP